MRLQVGAVSVLFYHSDWHFNHDFVARTRGYATSQEHDDALIDSINTVATKRDHIWVLGDVFMGSVTAGLKQIERIRATKHLVLGNHDAVHPMHKGSHNKLRRFLEVFETVSLHEQHTIAGRKVMLSHFPYAGDHYDADRYEQWRLRDEGLWLINGHVHHAWLRNGRQINVGVDYWPVPVRQSDLAEKIAASG
jgi:calcineurin-like phosphoesterase family protein